MTEEVEVAASGFAPGDIVSLRSGGEAMTVISVKPNGVYCALWNCVTGKPEGTTVAAVALELVEAA